MHIHAEANTTPSCRSPSCCRPVWCPATIPLVNRLFLVRHGITEANHLGVYQGQTDVPLSTKGRLQLAALRERLRDERFTAAYSSVLSRARVSAEILLEEHFCPLRETPDLNEISYGEWEGLTRAQVQARFPEAWAYFVEDPAVRAAPGGETRPQLRARAGRVLEEVADQFEDASILIASHGGTLREIIGGYLNLPADEIWKLRLENASLSIVDVYAGGGVLTLFNDTAHLGPRKTSLGGEPVH
jgi:broad specificity phosphatase PhoE